MAVMRELHESCAWSDSSIVIAFPFITCVPGNSKWNVSEEQEFWPSRNVLIEVRKNRKILLFEASDFQKQDI